MKNYIQDIERALYDVRDEDKSVYKSDAGLTEEIIRDISNARTTRRGCLSSG